MIKIVTESGPTDIASTLNPVAKIEGIPEMQKSIKTLQMYIEKGNGDIGALRLGVEGVYYALWPLINLEHLRSRGWKIQEKDTSDGRSPVLTVSDFRNWVMDDGVSWDEINTTFDGLIAAGDTIREMLKNHKESEEMNYNNATAGYAEVTLNGNSKILNDLCIGGNKGGSGRNNYGPFEKILGVMLECDKFPKDGKDGSGDISFGNILIEVKSVNNDKLLTKCEVPPPQMGFTSSCLLLVKSSRGVKTLGTGDTIQILCFRNQDILNRVLRHGELISSRTLKPMKDVFDKDMVEKIFANKGKLGKAILYHARIPKDPNNLRAINVTDEFEVDDGEVNVASDEIK